MERNTATTVEKLLIGDRFYKCTDKKKEVYTMVEGETKKTYFRTYRFFALKDKALHPIAINKDTAIVFLRHKEATV